MSVLDESLEPPERPDFRRVGRGVPLVMNPDTGKFERYKRSSGAGSILDDDANLVDWSKRTIVEGAAQRPDLMALVSVLDHEADKKEIRDIAEQCLVAGKGTQRATTGTAIHRMLDHVDLGHDWTPAPQFRDAVQSYVTTLEIYGLVPVDVEAQCVDDRLRLAGTMDRRYRTTRNLVAPDGVIIPIGSILAADTKTGRSLEYASGTYTCQLAAYAGSVRYDPQTNERTPFDPPTFPDWGLIIHVDADDNRTDVYWSDLEAGRQGLTLAQAVRDWRKRTDMITPARAPLYPVAGVWTKGASAPPDVPRTSPAAPEAPAAPDGAPDALAPVRAWLRERINVIRAAGERPTDMLRRKWPEGVPGLKFDTQTEAMLDAVVDVLDAVEAEWSIPFGAPDPRTPAAPVRDFASRWSKPTGHDRPDNDADLSLFRHMLMTHPRAGLIREWTKRIPPVTQAEYAEKGDSFALLHALYEFAMLPLDEWSDDNVTLMLDGTIRAIGHPGGIDALGDVAASEAPIIMSSAFAIMAGTALLLYGDDGLPVVRTVS